jgi:GT2 family glycosyltransferase
VPDLCVVVSTRNRGAAVVGTLRSLLAEPDPKLEVVVIDQSDDETTGAAIREAFVDPRLRYERSPRRGISAGRNEGTALSRAPIVAMTDDDCEAVAGFVCRVRDAFSDPRVALVFGSVLPGPHDRRLGLIPACLVREPYVGTRLRDKVNLDGMGACMAFRRDLWISLEGFDESLGAGSPLLAGEETDFCLRSLLAGRTVLLTPRIEVVHHGFRPMASVGDLVRGYWFGTGAVFVKLFRCGHVAVGGLVVRLAWRSLLGASPVARSLMGAATRRARLIAFGRGVLAGSRLPVDASSGHFKRG